MLASAALKAEGINIFFCVQVEVFVLEVLAICSFSLHLFSFFL